MIALNEDSPFLLYELTWKRYGKPVVKFLTRKEVVRAAFYPK